MIERCVCGNTIYFLDEDCSYCGRKIDFKKLSEEKNEEDPAEKPNYADGQRVLFKC